MTVLIGTSGWQYASWKEPYYAGVPQRRWFEHLLTGFRTVELNVSFYRLPKRETFAGWRERSPADAVVTVKASRYLTHIKRLRDPGPSVALLMERAGALGAKLGPVLVQLPLDLRERGMLGDTGSNAIGAVAGLWLVLTLDRTGQAIALAVMAAVTVYGEFRSIAAVIDRAPVLRHLDSLGRTSHA